MKTVEGLKRLIQSTEDLYTVVKTMKALAAVNIRQYERAVESLSDYNKTITMGLRVVLGTQSDASIRAKTAVLNRVGIIIFGSDQGMCGPLNEQVFSHAMDTIEKLEIGPQDRTFLAAGERMQRLVEERLQPVEQYVSVPGSTAGITPAVHIILTTIESWNLKKGISHVFLFHAKQLSGASYRPNVVHLLPVDAEWLRNLREQAWPSRSLPIYTMNADSLFSSLIRQYLFVSLFRAFAESLASENASRLAAMQRAEKNIEERLGALNAEFHQQRQMSITSELLDIVAGFEALKENN